MDKLWCHFPIIVYRESWYIQRVTPSITMTSPTIILRLDCTEEVCLDFRVSSSIQGVDC